MWNILICDDDPDVLTAIKTQLSDCASDLTETVQAFPDTDELFFYLEGHPREACIILMDIEFHGEKRGIGAAKRLLTLQPDSQMIFISAFPYYFQDVYDVEHINFLIKPFSNIRLRGALKKAGEKIEENFRTGYTIVSKNSIIRLSHKSIWWLEGKDRKVCLHTNQGECWSKDKLEQIVKELGCSFVQCHKSYAVNLSKVKGMEPSSFLLRCNVRVPISRRYSKAAKERFLKFLGSEQ